MLHGSVDCVSARFAYRDEHVAIVVVLVVVVVKFHSNDRGRTTTSHMMFAEVF